MLRRQGGQPRAQDLRELAQDRTLGERRDRELSLLPGHLVEADGGARSGSAHRPGEALTVGSLECYAGEPGQERPVLLAIDPHLAGAGLGRAAGLDAGMGEERRRERAEHVQLGDADGHEDGLVLTGGQRSRQGLEAGVEQRGVQDVP